MVTKLLRDLPSAAAATEGTKGRFNGPRDLPRARLIGTLQS
jgi:hypothetical protein